MEKWLILGQWQDIHKVSLERLVVPESKEVLKTTINSDGDISKGHWGQQKEFSEVKVGTI